ncbi:MULTISPECIES: hypothetical protein [unclassified Bilifractor]|uniref:hypothetical protein n=1 Tax=unclassified Bilifractor TaxID=2815795 RepID=UPI003F8D99CB
MNATTNTISNTSNTIINSTDTTTDTIRRFHIFSSKKLSPQKRISIMVRLSCLSFLVVLFTIIWNL